MAKARGPRMSTTTGRLQALAAAVLFSTGGAGLKAEAFSAAQMSGLRSGVAALVLFAWLGGRVDLSLPILGASLLYAATVSLFVAATKLTTAAAAIFLQSAALLLIIPLAPLVLGERFRPRDALFLAPITAGLWLSFAGGSAASQTAPDPGTGNLLALGSCASWALTLLSLRALERRPGGHGAGLQVAAVGNAVAALVALPFGWPLPSAPVADWATVVYLGVFQIAAAYWCLTAALRKLPALEASILLLIEPVLNPVWTWLIRGEAPGAATVAGGGLIVGATFLRAVVTVREAPSPPSP
jgi:drug/metabolite transporter, DME family